VAQGYDGVGVQQIVEDAGITKPTLYHHFGNKRGLLEALLRESLAPLFGELSRAAGAQNDLPVTLYELTRATFAFARQQPEVYRLLLSLWFAPTESEAGQVAAPFGEQHSAIIEGVFLAAANDRGNLRGRHKFLAATFLGVLHCYIALALRQHTEPSDAQVYQAVHQFMHGIFS
jgi:TetR/AcrR family transcriptional regulator